MFIISYLATNREILGVAPIRSADNLWPEYERSSSCRTLLKQKVSEVRLTFATSYRIRCSSSILTNSRMAFHVICLRTGCAARQGSSSELKKNGEICKVGPSDSESVVQHEGPVQVLDDECNSPPPPWLGTIILTAKEIQDLQVSGVPHQVFRDDISPLWFSGIVPAEIQDLFSGNGVLTVKIRDLTIRDLDWRYRTETAGKYIQILYGRQTAVTTVNQNGDSPPSCNETFAFPLPLWELEPMKLRVLLRNITRPDSLIGGARVNPADIARDRNVLQGADWCQLSLRNEQGKKTGTIKLSIASGGMIMSPEQWEVLRKLHHFKTPSISKETIREKVVIQNEKGFLMLLSKTGTGGDLWLSAVTSSEIKSAEDNEDRETGSAYCHTHDTSITDQQRVLSKLKWASTQLSEGWAVRNCSAIYPRYGIFVPTTCQKEQLVVQEQMHGVDMSPAYQGGRPDLQIRGENPSRRLRTDVLTLGFEHFDYPFNPRRVLCVYRKSPEDEDAVELAFFHPQGMALLFGVGVPFSTVLLRESGDLEVREIGQALWEQAWMASESKDDTLALFSYTDTIATEQRSGAVTLSSTDAAECFGVGVEGMSLTLDDPEIPRNFSKESETVKPLEWTRSLLQVLKYSTNVISFGDPESLGETDEATASSPSSSGRDSQLEGVESQFKPVNWIQSLSQVVNESNDVEPAGDAKECGETPKSDVHSPSSSAGNSQVEDRKVLCQSEMFNLSRQTGAGNQPLLDNSRERKPEKQGNLLQLTVKIFLDPSTQNLCNRSEPVQRDQQGTTFQVPRGEPAVSSEVECFSKAVYHLSDFQMAPQVTITFFCEPAQTGILTSKRFNSTLDAGFHIESSLSNPGEFGWYHNNLQVSFKCTDVGAVRREMKDLNQEIVSKHERKWYERSHGIESSASALNGKSGELKVGGGPRDIANGTLTFGFKREGTTTKVKTNTISTGMFVTMLEDANFSIKRWGQPDELAYKASLFPPSTSYGIWDPEGRAWALESGMMSTIPIKVSGDWTVIDDDNVIIHRICEYKFSCQRNLCMHQIITKPEDKRKSKSRTFNAQEEHIDYHELEQRINRVFYINHSFSHMQRLKRPTEYQWNVREKPQAPDPIRRILY